MKKTKLFLSTIVIALCGTFILVGKVNATEIDTINFNLTSKPVLEEKIITTGTTNDHLTAEVTKIYESGTIEEPEDEIALDGDYEYLLDYIIEVTFTPEEGYTISDNATYTYGDTSSYGHFVSKDTNTGAVKVNFELPLYSRIQFETNLNVDVEDQLVKAGESIALPTVPDQDGYTFYGWHYDEDYYFPYDILPVVYGNMTLYGLYADNNKIIDNVNVTLTLPKINTKFTVKTIEDDEIQNPHLTVKTDNSNVSAEAVIMKNCTDYDNFFSGVIQNGSKYCFAVGLETQNGYSISKTNTTITVNGQKATILMSGSKYIVVIYNTKITGQKLNNPMTVTTKKKTVKLKKVSKKKQVVSAITVKNAQGTVVYQKTSGKKNFKVNSKTGKITVKKGTKKGTYKIKVKITAKGNNNYNSKTKTVTVKMKVK